MKLLTIKEASIWASAFINKYVTESNISYLIQYGKVRKYEDNGSVCVSEEDLKKYYNSYLGRREIEWKEKLGEDLNWALSFDNYKEKETTKHVHRLHPYKGKFIPQLVEYFLDSHVNLFKKEVYFKEGDIVLDPFCGSGTTLVQANELGLHAVGLDISFFNTLISNVKIRKHNILELYYEIDSISKSLKKFLSKSKIFELDNELLFELAKFNNVHFSAPDYRYKVNRGEVNEKEYGPSRAQEFLPIYEKVIKKYGIILLQKEHKTFLDKWYLVPIREEIDYIYELVNKISNSDIRDIITIILSRTIRSCRATTHSDLATLVKPISTSYYCTKHKKICKPLFSIKKMWDRYSKDTLKRLQDFDKLRTDTQQICLTGDSRKIDLYSELKKDDKNKKIQELLKKKKIQGIFSSPPYVGMIDYHEQHAYAYDLFGFVRNDEKEIGPMSNGKGQHSKDLYIDGIASVLKHCKQYLVDDYDVFLVANDQYNLYPEIANRAGMQIVNKFRRPVLNRTERDKGAYSETIFHFKKIK